MAEFFFPSSSRDFPFFISNSIASLLSSGLGSLSKPGTISDAASGSFFLIKSKANRLALGGCSRLKNIHQEYCWSHFAHGSCC